jgi:DNA repair protein RecN (Recombination protein N)
MPTARFRDYWPMLRELSIRNFAIIDDLTIRFTPGLTILSGETGAGKSVLINAVNLVLGSRSSVALIRTGCEAAELEAFFNVSAQSATARIMDKKGYAADEGLLIRRIISHKDGNRIYINGRLATMQLLGQITENLASIAGQHAHQNLLKEAHHLLILDQFGGLMPRRRMVSDTYRGMLPLVEKRDRLLALKRQQVQQAELLRFQRDEIESAALSDAEDARLERERARLKNSEMLLQIVHAAVEDIYSGQGAVRERLAAVRQDLERAARVDSALSTGIEQLTQIDFMLEELTDRLRDYLKTVEVDAGRLEAVEERLDLINKIKRKYGGTLEAVSARGDAIGKELSEIENVDEKAALIEEQLAKSHRRLAKQTLQLSRLRHQTAKALALAVETELEGLNMGRTRFEVALDRAPLDPGASVYFQVDGTPVFESGLDRAAFKIAPNVGEELRALSAVASGGELSRIVLALKSIMAASDAVETIIFDEVDAGIGGVTAETVGQKLRDLADHHQVICITHLPQIAKFGDQHLGISKRIVNGRTTTNITALDEGARVEELSRMLGGIDITPTTREHARELLKRR